MVDKNTFYEKNTFGDQWSFYCLLINGSGSRLAKTIEKQRIGDGRLSTAGRELAGLPVN